MSRLKLEFRLVDFKDALRHRPHFTDVVMHPFLSARAACGLSSFPTECSPRWVRTSQYCQPSPSRWRGSPRGRASYRASWCLGSGRGLSPSTRLEFRTNELDWTDFTLIIYNCHRCRSRGCSPILPAFQRRRADRTRGTSWTRTSWTGSPSY